VLILLADNALSFRMALQGSAPDRNTTNNNNNEQIVSPTSTTPTVLACGYRQIVAPKSGLTFPTFLVSLDDQHQAEAVWRSKRDFLLLGRVSKLGHHLPKAAMKKLSEPSNFPWKRPGVELPYYANSKSNSKSNNHYHVSMKKSLLQLDQFLQQLAASKDIEIQEAWEKFCRPGDTEGLVPLEEEKVDSETGESSVGDAVCTTATGTTTTSQHQSSRLGQYFCSKENAQQVVRTALDKVEVYLLKKDKSVPLFFLEPSCGHGDIVVALVNELAARKVPPSRVSIHGFDIDPNAIRTCQNLQISSSNNDYSISWTCQNFLDTTIIPKDWQITTQKEKEPVVVCLGGPPYTTGAGSGVDMQRDLPTQFLEHCRNEWNTSVVCFLLPARYRDISANCETYDLASSTFFFQGSTRVTQPSILQCYSLE
jgi:hypothetical protein